MLHLRYLEEARRLLAGLRKKFGKKPLLWEDYPEEAARLVRLFRRSNASESEFASAVKTSSTIIDRFNHGEMRDGTLWPELRRLVSPRVRAAIPPLAPKVPLARLDPPDPPIEPFLYLPVTNILEDLLWFLQGREGLLERLSRLEQICVSWLLHGVSQVSVAAAIGVSQPTVSYTAHRAYKRLQFLAFMLPFRDGAVQAVNHFIPETKDREILLRFMETTCQSVVARRMGMTQGRVRYRITRSIARLRDAGSRYAEVFQTLLDHVQLLHHPPCNKRIPKELTPKSPPWKLAPPPDAGTQDGGVGPALGEEEIHDRIQRAKALLPKGPRVLWKEHIHTIIQLLLLLRETGLTIKEFSQKIDLDRSYLSYFSRGKSTDRKPWPKLIGELQKYDLLVRRSLRIPRVYTQEDIDEVMGLLAGGIRRCDVAKVLRIPERTIGGWVERGL